MSARPGPDDERRQPAGPDPDWCEWCHFEWFEADGSSGGWVRTTLYPNRSRSSFRAGIVAPGGNYAVIVDDELPLPSPGGTWEIRGSGLWVDLVCESPLDHWSVGLEAFAVGLDDPDDVFASGRGDRVPVGLDLGFEDVGPPVWADPESTSYGAPTRVAGEVLRGPDRLPIDGWGWRGRGKGSVFRNRLWTELKLRRADGSWSTGRQVGIDRPHIERSLDAPAPEAGGRWYRTLISGATGQGWIGSWVPD